jgi:DNA ligase-1
VRTCKHLVDVLGVEYDKWRTKGNTPTAGRAIKVVKMASPKLLLANKWNGKQNMTGWWMSEKLDGVRAWWDGKRFLSRQGNMFNAPDWYK